MVAVAIRFPAGSVDLYGRAGTPKSLVPPIPERRTGSLSSMPPASNVCMSLPSQWTKATAGGV